jgi:AraC family ethanolamine operon transcriptional activator
MRSDSQGTDCARWPNDTKVSAGAASFFRKDGRLPEVGETAVQHRRLSFRDFDALAEAAQEWDLTLLQCEPGAFWGRLDQVLTRRVQLGRARFGRAVLQQGGSPAGMLTFGAPVKGSEEYQWRNRQVMPDRLLVFPRGGEFQSASGAGFHSYPVSIHPDLFEEVAADLGVPTEDLRSDREVIRPRARDLAALRAHLRMLLDGDERSGARTGLLRAAEQETTELVIRALTGAESVRKPAARLRDRAIRRAEAMIQSAGREPLLVRDICRASGASWRTLNYAFREKYGLTVKRYLMVQRLNGLRRDLLEAERSTPISEVAAQWGFWHMGMLADQYRRLFGELPSETRKRTPTRSKSRS